MFQKQQSKILSGDNIGNAIMEKDDDGKDNADDKESFIRNPSILSQNSDDQPQNQIHKFKGGSIASKQSHAIQLVGAPSIAMNSVINKSSNVSSPKNVIEKN
jgi:hypothetical protein